ncbi:hypothetical protein BVC80_9069g29 [Macleaya cordata]|uniref:Uncharacterized protein n=1 Tax=Macleaya cordata TaxID=56857 RepID=A0A200PNY4_MACCD|nr:hypothetical protein BVC80_9069g29 [Macleaya cordata]
MDPNRRVSQAEGSSSNGGEINSQMVNPSGSKRKVRENGSSPSSSSSSICFNVEGHHLKIDRLIDLVELLKKRQTHLLTSLEEKFEDFLFSESDCEDDEEDQAGMNLLNIKEKASSSSIPQTMDGLHLKFDWLIKLLELENKKRFSTSSSSSSTITNTVDGIDLKFARLVELIEWEKKKHKRFCNVVSTFLKTKFEDFEIPEYAYESDSDSGEEGEEEQSCVID